MCFGVHYVCVMTFGLFAVGISNEELPKHLHDQHQPLLAVEGIGPSQDERHLARPWIEPLPVERTDPRVASAPETFTSVKTDNDLSRDFEADDDGSRLPIKDDEVVSQATNVKPALHVSKHIADHRFKLISLENLVNLNPALQVTLWIFVSILVKAGFHVTPKLSLICPESCLLIVVGVVIGLLLFYAGLSNVGPLTPNIFFLYMLPPIVLDAGYFMPNRPFFDNLVTILMFAVLGTVLNALSVGVSLWAVGLTGLYGVEMPLLNTLLFSSIACAVDPIAVLAVFEEIHVNEVLYILVFGESLLNDAVTVVLYHMFEGYTEMGPENIITVDYLAGVASFFVVAIGGTVVGILWGLLAAFVSRFTHHVRVIEPLFVFVMSYLSYVSAELFHFSGILSLTFCGITMKNYVEENISYKSHVTVKYAMKMLASSSETIIFLFLGVSTVNDNHEWNTWFVIMTLLFCTIYRAIGVVFLSSLANRFRLHRINGVEQFIMAYGGLRGAVAFALVLIVSDQIIPTKNMMVTTIIALVFFTVFLQGMTIGPLVRILNVPKSNKIKLSMNERILTRSMDHLMAAIEDIVGQKLGNYHLRDKFKYYNNKFIRPLLTRDHAIREPKIFETYSKLNLADAMDLVKRNNSGLLRPTVSGATSFSSMYRSYTLNQLDTTGANDGDDQKSVLPRNNSSFLNVDIAELEYSPSHKDLADAELHHILADAMSNPPRRHRRNSRNHVEGKSNYRNHWRPHSRYFSHRRRSSFDHYRHHNHSDRGRREFVGRSNTLMPPPPELTFSYADDKPEENEDVRIDVPEGQTSNHSSCFDVSSASHDDGAIFFVAHESRSSLNADDRITPDIVVQSSDNETTIEDHETPHKTLTESSLPWKRHLSEDIDEEQLSLRSFSAMRSISIEDIPARGFPERAGRRYSTPAPRTVLTGIPNHGFHEDTYQHTDNPSASDVELNEVKSPDFQETAPTNTKIKNPLDMVNHGSQTKDIIIEFTPNGNAVPLHGVAVDDHRSQATKL